MYLLGRKSVASGSLRKRSEWQQGAREFARAEIEMESCVK